MKKYTLALFFFVFLLCFGAYLEQDDWENTVKETLPTNEGFSFLDEKDWQASLSQAKEELPPIYPFSLYTGTLKAGKTIALNIQAISELSLQAKGSSFETAKVESLFDNLNEIRKSVKKITDNVDHVPSFLLKEDDRQKQKEGRDFLVKIQKALVQIADLQNVINYWIKTDSRVLILLQNQNEPRSTGGFVGSLFVVDFSEEKISWQFFDTYALDRLIPDEKEFPAPEFFHPLSQTISLRDANFWPHFEDSANAYRYFFGLLGEKEPETVITLNLNTIKELVKIVEEVSLPEWGLTLNEENFDLGLQFLVESKAAGRMEVKKPVEDFARALFAPESMGHFQPERILSFDWYGFIKNKNILAHSQNKDIQKVIRKWSADGSMVFDPSAHNTLYFDFISVGANKSERFITTKIEHHSIIFEDGTVENVLEIDRTHEAHEGLIEEMINFDSLPEDLKTLKDQELIWKLGEGESRIILRVYVPAESHNINGNSPSGIVKEYMDDKTNFKIIEIPLNVKMSETVSSRITYQTQIKEGTYTWRPYTLELKATPGRNKTSFKALWGTPDGQLVGKTQNIGESIPLRDDFFIGLIEY